MITRILYYYYRTIFLKYYLTSRKQLNAYQAQKLKALVNKTLKHSPFYQQYLNKPFHEWPIMNKNMMNENFDEINTVKIKKSQALDIALQAEATRDFSPLIHHIAVGLSSGTSGQRGLFLTSPHERDAWAGIILAKVLPDGLKSQERIAFFLRANNPLYSTINKRKKIQFHFFDLLACFDTHIQHLNHIKPTILSAPASVLYWLATQKHRLMIKPKKIIAIAEVLEPTEELFISNAFNLPVAQIYQCTEGFLAVSDKATNQLVMNEEFLIIEKEWIDTQRFIPVITDLMRTTQPIIRYRLDDILIQSPSSSIYTQLSAIEGRAGDVCYGVKDHKYIPIFADTLRQLMASSPIQFEDYLILQIDGKHFHIHITPEPDNKSLLINHLNQVFEKKGCDIPMWIWKKYEERDRSTKKRRIQSQLQHPIS